MGLNTICAKFQLNINSAGFELGAVRPEKLSLAFLTLKLTSEVNENFFNTIHNA